MAIFHLDNDYLVYATSQAGVERARLLELAASEATLGMSAVAWYEYARGPRTPEQLALARFILDEEGVVPLDDELATRAAETFRLAGSPRRRANDIAIGVTAASRGAILLTRNERDFSGIAGLILESP
jgi:predicted nucleic acid-binding protein